MHYIKINYIHKHFPDSAKPYDVMFLSARDLRLLAPLLCLSCCEYIVAKNQYVVISLSRRMLSCNILWDITKQKLAQRILAFESHSALYLAALYFSSRVKKNLIPTSPPQLFPLETASVVVYICV